MPAPACFKQGCYTRGGPTQNITEIKIHLRVMCIGARQWNVIWLYEPRFTARRDLWNIEEMMNETLRSLAQKMAQEINSFTSSYSPSSQ